MSRSLGVWTVGALGGIGTTMAVGARAIARDLVSGTGLVTNTPAFDALDLVPIDALVFGGHEVREGDYFESAKQIYERNRSIDLAVIQDLKDDLLDMSEALKPGTCVNAGSAIEELATNPVTKMDTPLRSIVQQIQTDLRSFRAREGIDDVVVVNLASTEPDLPEECAASDAAAFEVLLDQDQRDLARPSMLYAYAAF